MRFRRRLAIAALLLAAANGCASKSESMPPLASYHEGAARMRVMQPFRQSNLPILRDTSPSTAGIFLGAACGPKAVVTCPSFAATFRHELAIGTVYADWDTDLSSFIAANSLQKWAAGGTIPEITWQPKSRTSTITLASIDAGRYDVYIATSARELKAFGDPVLLRPFHEFNGSQYPWSLSNNGASVAADRAFVAAWRRVYAIFQHERATNVKFVWCYTNGSVPDSFSNPWNDPRKAYPGDAYVDWVGIDTYNRGSRAADKWAPFDETIATGYRTAITTAPLKPIAIAEIASNEYGDGGTLKAAWISQMFSELQAGKNGPYPNVRAVTWFESNTNGYLYASQSSQPAYTAFVNAIRTRSAAGLLNFRSNGSALMKVIVP